MTLFGSTANKSLYAYACLSGSFGNAFAMDSAFAALFFEKKEKIESILVSMVKSPPLGLRGKGQGDSLRHNIDIK